MSEQFWAGIALFATLVLLFRGWPSFITIHKHYHSKGGE